MHKIFGRIDCQTVHHLHASRNNACANHIANGGGGSGGVIKANKKRPLRCRFLQDSQGDFADNTEQALRAGHHAHQIIITRIQMLAPEPQNFALDCDKLNAQ